LADYLLVLEVLESKGDLVLSLLVEDDIEASRVVVDLEHCAHRLLFLSNDAANDNDLQQWSEKVSNYHGIGLSTESHAHARPL